jgi:hypothetical protein
MGPVLGAGGAGGAFGTGGGGAVGVSGGTAAGGLISGAGGGGGSLNFGGSKASGGASSSGGATNCGTRSKPEEIIEYTPVGIFIMQDRSSSMITGIPAPATPEGWNQSSAAVTAFVNDRSSAGLSVGLGVFPPMTGAAECATGANCGAPVVPMAALPQNAPPLVAGMQSATPPPQQFGTPPLFTPTECGLRGMVAQCKAFTAATQIACAAVLVTDGNPTECSQDTAVLSGVLAQALTEKVKTFVIGLPGANLATLDLLAQAGGTTKAIDVSAGTQAFIAALNTIRTAVSIGTKLECEWTIPDPPKGQELEKEKVNLKFTPKGGASVDFGYVNSEAECAGTTNAWRFDNNDAPTKILVCPGTCDMLKASSGAAMDVEFGCARIPAIIQ